MPTQAEVDKKRAEIARAHGIRNARIALEEARRTEHVGPALAVAMLWQESHGKNVWGHDPTIFIGGFDKKNNRFWTAPQWKGYVNEAGYKEYRKQRVASGNKKMQGVGPFQLTWWEFQDGADKLGGCWLPRPNIRYGIQRLDDLIDTHGYGDGIRRYNGSGVRAEQYREEVLGKRNAVRDWFGIG